MRRVRSYGRIAASGIVADDDAKVDEAVRILSTLASLDAADLKVLLHMAGRETQPWFVFPHSSEEPIPVLIEELPELGDVIDPIISRLQGLGLLVDRLEDTIYADGQVVSRFARMCVRELMRGEDAGT